MSHIHGLVTKIAIKADAQGNPPSTIEVLRTGDWNTPWHGDFQITLADLHEFAANFAKGTGLVEGDQRAPINYAHESWDKAAGWMTALTVDDTRQALVASCDWTPEAEQALKDGEWSYISPEFNPRGCPWEDPEGSDDADGIPVFVNNVLTGAALTNIPLFKKLKPIMASRVPSKKKKADVTSGDGNKSNSKGESMNIEEIRKKQAADLTDEEKTFLSEHKAELTDDERTTFGLVDEAETPETPETPEVPETSETPVEQPEKKVEASAKGVQISADRLKKLEADAEAGRKALAQLERSKAEGIVASAVKDGRIKSGDKDGWVNTLLASSERATLESLIAGLPKNEALGQEIGGAGVEASTDASEELHNKVAQKIKASAAEGKTLSYYEVQKDILATDTALAARVKEEKEN